MWLLNDGRLKLVWRILIFICFLLLAIAPLIIINNSLLQFIGATFILLYGLYLNSKYLDKRPMSDYGIVFSKKTFIHLLNGISIGSLSVIAIFLIGKITGILLVTEPLVPSIDVWGLLLFAIKMLFVATLEEAFFRGYLFTTIYDGFSTKRGFQNKAVVIGAVVSSVLFGLAHIGNSYASVLSISFLSINGVVWCIPFILTKNLGLSIGLHAAWNFAQTQVGFTMSGNEPVKSLFIIENKGPDLWTGGEYGPEAGLLGLIGFAIMLSLSLIYLNSKRRI